MFIVKCRRDGRGQKWHEYSAPMQTAEEAEAVKRYAEQSGNTAVTGAKIIYKVFRF